VRVDAGSFNLMRHWRWIASWYPDVQRSYHHATSRL